jgi:hypothetical protein
MARVPISQKDSIVDQLEQLHQRIARRAYDLFRGRDGWGDAFGDWLSAEQELAGKPPVELREQTASSPLRRPCLVSTSKTLRLTSRRRTS